jgi:hypothetical protein
MSWQQLIKVESELRDELWEDRFLTALTECRLNILSADPQTGPDGWPYLFVEISEDGEPAQKVLHWLATRGIGLAVNPDQEYPDFILSWGMIWYFRETGRFFRRDVDSLAGRVELSLAQIAHAGTPSPQFLPDYVRSILREFFRDQGVLNPRILVLSQDRANYELAFSLESLGNPPESEHEGIAEAVSWFLPPHYSLLLISEQGLPPFGPL